MNVYKQHRGDTEALVGEEQMSPYHEEGIRKRHPNVKVRGSL